MIKHGCKLNVTSQLGKSNQIMPCSILVQSRVWHWEWMWGQYRVIIYHSQALPVTAKEEPVVPYHCLKTYSLLWKKADNISVLRFTLCTSLRDWSHLCRWTRVKRLTWSISHRLVPHMDPRVELPVKAWGSSTGDLALLLDASKILRLCWGLVKINLVTGLLKHTSLER